MSVTFENVIFDGEGDVLVPAFCRRCGPVQCRMWSPFGEDRVSLFNSAAKCPKCGQLAELQDGNYDFTRQAISLLAQSNVTRKQAKRFSQKIKTSNDVSTLPGSARAISPKLEEAITLALKQKDPKSALKTVLIVLSILGAAGGGLLTADQLWDRFAKGELFEKHQLQDAEPIQDDTKRKSKDPTKNRKADDGTFEWAVPEI